MRNIFGYNVTENEDAPADGQVFLRASVPAYHEQRLNAQTEQLTSSVKKLISWPMLIGEVVLAGVGLGLIEHFFDILGEQKLEQIDYILPAVGLGCLVMMGVLFWADRRRRKSVIESDEFKAMKTDVENAADTSQFLLGIPAETADLDVLSYIYKVRNGQKKPVDKDQDYVNLSMYAWVEDGELLLANNSEKFAIPLSAITVRRREGKVKVFLWWKDETPKSPTYKPYKIKYDEDSDIFTLRAVYALEVTHNGEAYELLVPEYDWEMVLQPMIGEYVSIPVNE
ncbi:MAG: hypothetical protein IJ518_02975 [Clostridia bacterium]|nr:hypothetical protein [Clostridia bacterium]